MSISDTIKNIFTRRKLPASDDPRLHAAIGAILKTCEALKKDGWVCEHSALNVEGKLGPIIEMRFVKAETLRLRR